MSQGFDSLYEWYQLLYKTEFQEINPEARNKRIDIQAKLAQIIFLNRGDPRVETYVKGVLRKGSYPESVSEFPHIDEAVSSTEEINSLAQEMGIYLAPYSKVVAMFGSVTSGAYYSVHSKSDLDLEVVVPDFDEGISRLPLFKEEDLLRQGIHICKDGNLDMLLYKLVYKGRNVMFHFIPESSFARFMNIDLINPDKEQMGFRELRNYFNGVLVYTNRCSFSDDRKDWSAAHEDLENGWHIIEKPVYQFENGILFNGIFTEWHLTPVTVINGDVQWYTNHNNKLFFEFAKRFSKEKNSHKKSMRFSNILERKHRMPQWLLEQIDQRAEVLGQQAEGI